MAPHDSLHLTKSERRELESELLGRLATFGRPVELSDWFGPAVIPRWASEAAARLLADGRLGEDAEGRLVIPAVPLPAAA